MSRGWGDYLCDGCAALAPDDGWQPPGWVHTMMGEDLCGECKHRQLDEEGAALREGRPPRATWR